ncbi:MAG: hypothetical protein K2L82_07795 [Lachnospiraceae bacterium]|nr:hypothetical protein [Lachnospiraceae bacterium]
MIHNIEDEKKKMNRQRNDGFSGGLTDEALMELIRQVESEEMIHAPRHLKENIFDMLRRERRTAKKMQVFTYRVKVLAAMAAALTVLIFMPDDRAESVEKIPVQQEESGFLEEIAMQRQKDRDEDWERYLVQQERGGVRGFFDGVNEKVTQFGTELYHSINKQ